MMYDINLKIVGGSDTYHSYDWPEIPVVGDKLSVSETEILVVRDRLLPTTKDSNRVILFCDIFEVKKKIKNKKNKK